MGNPPIHAFQLRTNHLRRESLPRAAVRGGDHYVRFQVCGHVRDVPRLGTPLFAASEGVMLPAGGTPLGAPALPGVSSVRARAPDRRDPRQGRGR